MKVESADSDNNIALFLEVWFPGNLIIEVLSDLNQEDKTQEKASHSKIKPFV
jgi:hypothetical protein